MGPVRSRESAGRRVAPYVVWCLTGSLSIRLSAVAGMVQGMVVHKNNLSYKSRSRVHTVSQMAACSLLSLLRRSCNRESCLLGCTGSLATPAERGRVLWGLFGERAQVQAQGPTPCPRARWLPRSDLVVSRCHRFKNGHRGWTCCCDFTHAAAAAHASA